MNKITLEKADISALEIRSGLCDLHHDIAIYMDYVTSKSIRRSAKTNYLLKGDIVRLAKLMKQELPINNFDADGSNYPDFIDRLAYGMGFVDFDVQGSYYDTYPENYIKIKGDNYQKYINLPLQEQEEKILDSLNFKGVASKDYNEFVYQSPIGILDHFQYYNIGYALEKIDIHKVRSFLFELLSQVEVNIWYDVKSFTDYLKYNHPYFLIPRQPEIVKTKSYMYMPSYMQQTSSDNRYYGFSDVYENETHRLSPDYKDVFERVEGRYIERFLEFIPFLLGYVELAYDYDNPNDFIPTIGMLSAFRITPRFIALRNKEIKEAKIMVQPNFEITIESDIYPAKIMSRLESIGHLLKKDVISQVRIEKNKVVQKVAREHDFDPIKYLSQISSSPLPDNVKIELKEWCGHADAFILYENTGLLESNFEFVNIEQFIVQKINKKFYIIKDTEALVNELERNQTIPIKKLRHKDSNFLESNEYKSIISKGKTNNKEVSNHLEKLKIGRANLIKLLFTTDKDLALFSNQLLEKGCMINISDSERAIIIDQKDEKLLNDTFKSIASQYKLEFDNK